MKKPYHKPITEHRTVHVESLVMACSVTVNPTVDVEEYHDASFGNGKSEWSIGFDESTD